MRDEYFIEKIKKETMYLRDKIMELLDGHRTLSSADALMQAYLHIINYVTLTNGELDYTEKFLDRQIKCFMEGILLIKEKAKCFHADNKEG